MKNNSVHITYRSEDLLMKKTVERMRCTTVEAARRILAKKKPDSIKKFIFIGPKGGMYPLKVK